MVDVKKYRKVKVVHGPAGWGGPVIVEPKPGKDLICSVTGGGIHAVAQRIAELTGGQAIDAFRAGKPMDQIACAVIDCGGTARVGVYPMKRIPTVDVIPSNPTGPLARFITADIFVSGCRVEDVTEVLD